MSMKSPPEDHDLGGERLVEVPAEKAGGQCLNQPRTRPGPLGRPTGAFHCDEPHGRQYAPSTCGLHPRHLQGHVDQSNIGVPIVVRRKQLRWWASPSTRLFL